MDAKLFRLPTKPNFYAGISAADPFNKDQKQKYGQVPAPDSRFPGWAGKMEDGRLVTNYQNNSSAFVPPEQQYATKVWMTRNGSDIIDLIRRRSSQQTSAGESLDPKVVPPPAQVVTCTTADCSREATHIKGSIGTERAPQKVPELFGTWLYTPSESMLEPNIELTKRYEGGRNTPRGGPPQLR
jgi:hypothetical protein